MHSEIHAELEQIGHRRAESEDGMLRRMTRAERDEYWREQEEWDALMASDTNTTQDMVDMCGSFD